MRFIDAHVHVWTPDLAHYPLAPGFKKEDMKPSSFTPDQLFKLCKPAGVDRINLIQMSYYDLIQMSHYGFDNRYMTGLARKRVRAFRIYPGLGGGIKPNQGTAEG